MGSGAFVAAVALAAELPQWAEAVLLVGVALRALLTAIRSHTRVALVLPLILGLGLARAPADEPDLGSITAVAGPHIAVTGVVVADPVSRAATDELRVRVESVSGGADQRGRRQPLRPPAPARPRETPGSRGPPHRRTRPDPDSLQR